MSLASEIILLEKQARRLGVCLFTEGGEIYGYPGSVFKKYPKLMDACYRHREGLIKWLKILTSQTSRAT